MKTYLFAFLLSLFSLGSSMAANITISLKETPGKPLKINFLSHKFFTEADTLYTLTLADTKPKTVTLLLSTPQFIDIQSPQIYAIGLFYIDPSQEYELVYDERQDKWEIVAGSVNLNKWLESDYKAITAGIRLYQPDSASFVSQFLHLTDSLKLYNNSVTNKSARIRHNYRRHLAFYSFVNTSHSHNHFKFDASATDSITRKITSLIDLNEIDLSIHSPVDFNALHYYHLVYDHEIFIEGKSSKTEKVWASNWAEVYAGITKWTTKLSAPDEVKAFLIGDFIKYHSMIRQYKFTEEALVFLKKYLEKYPDSPHNELVEKEYKKQYDRLYNSSVLVIDCEDVKGKKFRASAYDEKLLFIDFWATWCGPCIAEILT